MRTVESGLLFVASRVYDSRLAIIISFVSLLFATALWMDVLDLSLASDLYGCPFYLRICVLFYLLHLVCL